MLVALVMSVSTVGIVEAADPVPVPDANGNTVVKSENANITGKNNSVKGSNNAEIVGDKNEITDIFYAENGTQDGPVASRDARIIGSGNSIQGSKNQHAIGDNNKIIGRDDGTVTDYGHPEGREPNILDLTIGRGNFLRGANTYRNEWDSLTVIGNNNRADYDTTSADGPTAGIAIGDNQNIDEIEESIVIGSLSPSEQKELVGSSAQYDEKYKVGRGSTVIGYHTSNSSGGSVVIGNYSQAQSVFQTVTGPRSIIEGKADLNNLSGLFASS